MIFILSRFYPFYLFFQRTEVFKKNNLFPTVGNQVKSEFKNTLLKEYIFFFIYLTNSILIDMVKCLKGQTGYVR